VYVHLPNGFGYDKWLAALKAGRSFVSTGPMLFVTINNCDPGEKLEPGPSGSSFHVQGEAVSAQPLERIELVWNGDVLRNISPTNEKANNAFRTRFDLKIHPETSGWLAARCLAQRLETGGIPFAHTGPWHVELAGSPLEPRRRDVEYFVRRVEEEIERNRGILSDAQLADYYRARDFWRRTLEMLRENGNAKPAKP